MPFKDILYYFKCNTPFSLRHTQLWKGDFQGEKKSLQANALHSPQTLLLSYQSHLFFDDCDVVETFKGWKIVPQIEDTSPNIGWDKCEKKKAHFKIEIIQCVLKPS